MTDTETAAAEAEADPGVEPDAADDDVVEPDAAEDAEASGDEAESDDDGEQEPPEEVEFVFGNEKLRVRKDDISDELADRIDKFARGTWSDYTRKTQEIAERRQSVEAAEKALGELATLNEDVLGASAQARALSAQYAELQKIDLATLWQRDAQKAGQVQARMSQIEAAWRTAAETVHTKVAELQQAQQTERTRRADEGVARLQRNIKDFDKRRDEILDYAAAQGVSREDVDAGWAANPIVTEAFYKAMLWDRAQTASRKASPRTVSSVPTVKPKASGSGRGGPKPVEQMSNAEMAKHLGY